MMSTAPARTNVSGISDVSRTGQAGQGRESVAGAVDHHQPNWKTGDTPKKRRARRRRAAMAAAAVDRDTRVMNRYGGRCIAHGISPVCQGRAVDPHELVSVGAGGKREAYNRVPICRVDHREAQGRVGGARLKFDWAGRNEGRPPMADVRGMTKVTWQPNPKDPLTFTTTWR